MNEVFVIKQVGQPCHHGQMETWLYIIQVGYYTFFCLDLICYTIWQKCDRKSSFLDNIDCSLDLSLETEV